MYASWQLVDIAHSSNVVLPLIGVCCYPTLRYMDVQGLSYPQGLYLLTIGTIASREGVLSMRVGTLAGWCAWVALGGVRCMRVGTLAGVVCMGGVRGVRCTRVSIAVDDGRRWVRE